MRIELLITFSENTNAQRAAARPHLLFALKFQHNNCLYESAKKNYDYCRRTGVFCDVGRELENIGPDSFDDRTSTKHLHQAGNVLECGFFGFLKSEKGLQ